MSFIYVRLSSTGLTNEQVGISAAPTAPLPYKRRSGRMPPAARIRHREVVSRCTRGCRLLHILVHIVGAVDHYHPDHRHRNKPKNQRPHVRFSLLSCGPVAPTRPANVGQDRRSMAPLREHGRPGRFRTSVDRQSRRRLCPYSDHATQQKIASTDQSSSPETRATRHKFRINTIYLNRLFLRLNLISELVRRTQRTYAETSMKVAVFDFSELLLVCRFCCSPTKG